MSPAFLAAVADLAGADGAVLAVPAGEEFHHAAEFLGDFAGWHDAVADAFLRGEGLADGLGLEVRVADPERLGPAGGENGVAAAERVNALLLAEKGRRDWPLRFCSAELLFSKQARLGWVEPDLARMPVSGR